jgi:phosphoenolpyruvate-protein phosphotransferase (PTS system enzyme I)
VNGSESGRATRIDGVGASEGFAVGPVFVHEGREPKPRRESIRREAVEEELERFVRAVETVAGALTTRARELEMSGSRKEAEIFEAHAEMATDPELASEVEERVRDDLQSPEAAVLAVGEGYAEALAGMDDEYMAARADDVRDVAAQIAAELAGGEAEGLGELERPSVIVARNLVPSETARIPRGMALAFVTAEGSMTSHVSIMARSMGIPAVVGIGEKALAELIEAGASATIAVDGTEGYTLLNPDLQRVAELEARQARLSVERDEAIEEYRQLEARTRDGRRIEVGANLGSASEAEEALWWGAEGVGLFRTEFLFMERPQLPSEEEQYEAYAEVARVFGERPVVVRTLDVGGDKDLPEIQRPREENPFLGWRGIRMCLDVPDLFKVQLRAILRAARAGNLKVMFPMVVDVEELRAAREILAECERELEREGRERGEVEVGVMIETPAAAIMAGELAREVSFFSIGTNDLVQYTLAADRGNERLGRLHRPDHPAVMRLIELTCKAAREAGIWVGVCGEAAADPSIIPKLVEIGVSELSMSAPSIPRAKKIICAL